MVNKILGKLNNSYSNGEDQIKGLFRSGPYVLITRVAGAVINFGFTYLIAKFINASNVGIYFLAFNIMSLGSLIGRFGLDNTVLRLSAETNSRNDWNSLAGLYKKSVTITISICAIIIVLVLCSSEWLSAELFKKPQLEPSLNILGITILPSALIFLHSEFLKGLNKPVWAIFFQNVSIPFLSILIFLVLISFKIKTYWPSLAYSIAAFLSLGIVIIVFRKAIPQIHTVKGQYDIKKIIDLSTPFFIIAIMGLIMTNTDILLLGRWADPETIGIYGITKQISILLSFILVTVNIIVAPSIAVLYSKNDIKSLINLVKNATIISGGITTIPFFVLMIFPSWFLGLIGREYVNGESLLRILILGQYINAITGPVGYLLMMTEREKIMRNNIISATLICVTLNAVLIPTIGVIGAAIATTTSLAFLNINSTLLVYKKFSTFGIQFPWIK